MSDVPHQLNYKMSRTAYFFHRALDCTIRGVMGPVGSGKTSMMPMDGMNLASMIPPDHKNVRHMRSVYTRNTQAELMTTTKETWKYWLGPSRFEGCFHERLSPPYSMGLSIPPGRNPYDLDKCGLEWEIILLPMDSPDDVKKVLSLNITNFFANEARELEYPVIQELIGRCGRYPEYVNFEELPPAITGGVLDTNPPDDH